MRKKKIETPELVRLGVKIKEETFIIIDAELKKDYRTWQSFLRELIEREAKKYETSL